MMLFTDSLDVTMLAISDGQPLTLRVQPMPTAMFKATMLPRNEDGGQEVTSLWMSCPHDDLLGYLFLDSSPFIDTESASQNGAHSHKRLDNFVKNINANIENQDALALSLTPADTIVVVGNYSYPNYGLDMGTVLVVNITSESV